MANITFSNKTLVEGEIGNALKSTASDHVVAAAQNIYDTEFTTLTSNIGNNKGAYQNEINKYLLDRINENPVGTVTSITPGTGLTGASGSNAAITSSGTINLKPASTSEIGGIKLGYEEETGTNNYKVQVNVDNKAYVYVPWTDTKVTSDTHYKALGAAKKSNLYKTAIDEAGHITAADAVTTTDITNLLPNVIPLKWIGSTDTTVAAGNHTHSAYVTNEALNNKGYITATLASETYQPKGNYQPAGDYLTSLPAATTSKLGGIKVGTNLSVATDGTLSATNTTYSNATTSAAGLMSATDKSKLDNIAANANNYSLPATTATTLGGIKIGYSANDKNYPVALDANNKAFVNVPWTDTSVTGVETHYQPTTDPTKTTSGLYKVKVDAAGHITEATSVQKSDITGLGIASKLTVTTTNSSTISSLAPNTMYVCTYNGRVDINGFTAPAANEIATYSLFITKGCFKILPTIYWANGEIPDTTVYSAYEVVINGINTGSKTYYTATWSKYEEK